MEFSFQPRLFEESTRTLEIRPIIENRFGHAQLDLNPSAEIPLSNSLGAGGWHFEPSVRFAYEVTRRISPLLEYFAAIGPFARFLHLNRQVHQIFPGASFSIAKNVICDFSIGAGLTPSGNRVVFKSRVEFDLGQSK